MSCPSQKLDIQPWISIQIEISGLEEWFFFVIDPIQSYDWHTNLIAQPFIHTTQFSFKKK